MSGAQARGLREARDQRRAASSPGSPSRTLAIVSGKGGVGKSAIAANLAVAAARSGASTLLVDGDAGLANADLLLGLVPSRTWSDVHAGRATIDEAISRGPSGLELLVSGRAEDAVASLVVEMEAFIRGRPSGRIPVRSRTILDLGAGIGRDVVSLAATCERIWLVLTPEPTSLADAYAMLRRLSHAGPTGEIELVVNRAGDRGEAERAARSIQRLARRFLGRVPAVRACLPEDAEMGRAVLRQEPVVIGVPGAPISRSLRHLAESWLEETAPRASATPDRSKRRPEIDGAALPA